MASVRRRRLGPAGTGTGPAQGRLPRRCAVLVLAALLPCVGGAGAAPASAATPADAYPAAPPAAGRGDFAGLVDIGGHRAIFMECRGRGTPTVVLISGKGNGARDGWGEALDPADPVRQSPEDQVAIGMGHLQPSESAVFPAVAAFTRVCAYARPGTGLDGPETSTLVPQPHRVEAAVADVRAALDAAEESGPYVLVGHSYGGFIVRLFASRYPRDVAGLVMDDAVSEFMAATTTRDELANWDALNRTTDGTVEAVLLAGAIDTIRDAPAAPRVPAVVLSSDKPWVSEATEAQRKAFGALPTFRQWLAAQVLLAEALGAKHITDTNSGHNIEVYQPGLVTAAVREVVEAARRAPPAARRGLPRTGTGPVSPPVPT